MAKSWSEAMSLLTRLGEFKIIDLSFNMERNETSYHKVRHKYRDEIIVPYIAVQNNIDFMLNKGERYLLTADGIKAKVMGSKEVHVCELEADIKRLYNLSAWDYLCKWYNSEKSMDSMHLLHIKLRKEE